MDAKQFFDHLDDEQDVFPHNFLKTLFCSFRIEIFEKWGGEEEIAEEDQGGSVATLMIDQIEFANVILLNKVITCDLQKSYNDKHNCAVRYHRGDGMRRGYGMGLHLEYEFFIRVLVY
eukprot:UN00443